MVFEKKKISTETLSEYLSAIRKSAGLTLSEVAEKTGIKQVFLESLEAGNYFTLPADVYVCGFLRQLANMYGVEAASLVAQFKKEKGIFNQMQAKRQTDSHGWKNFLDRLTITPKILTVALAIFFVATSLVYIIWQVFSINREPALTVWEPVANQVVKTSFVKVRGKTDPGMSVTVNGQPVFVENDGSFETQLSLTSGPKDITVAAKNKFDKIVAKNITIVGEVEASVLSASLQNRVELGLSFTGDVDLIYTLDDGPETKIVFHKGDTKTLLAAKKVVISLSDAGATSGVLNGQPLGLLGRPGEVLSNLSFSAETATATTEGQRP